MALDRHGARRRVRTITVWAAAGATALSAGFAFGVARHSPAATNASTPSRTRSPAPRATPAPQPDYGAPQDFGPPAASDAPPQAMSGGS